MAVGEIEELEILDGNGKPTGKYVDRKIAHKQGIPHAHMAVIIVDTNSGKLLIQQRSEKVEKYPGKFDLLSGHIKKGKTEIDTLIAECKEEAGLEVGQGKITKVGSIPRDDVTNNGTFFEKGTTELYILEKDLSNWKSAEHDDEVDGLGLMSVSDFKKLMSEDKVVPRPNVWEAGISAVESLSKGK